MNPTSRRMCQAVCCKRRILFTWGLMLLIHPIPAQSETTSAITLTIIAHVPKESGTVYITGNRSEFGFWNPGFCAMEGDGDMPRTARLKAAAGDRIEFKFTLGSWETEALSDEGKVPENYVVTVGDSDLTFEVDIKGFSTGAKNAAVQSAEVLGTLTVKRDIPSEYLGRPRDVAI